MSKLINQEIILAGDWNINFLKMETKEKHKDFFDNLISHGFLPSITLPTRVTNSTATLIDQIFLKSSNRSHFSESGILKSRIYDHFVVFFCQSF